MKIFFYLFTLITFDVLLPGQLIVHKIPSRESTDKNPISYRLFSYFINRAKSSNSNNEHVCIPRPSRARTLSQ